MNRQKDGLQPLGDGSTVVIIGGGPGGAGCALALKNLSDEQGKRISVVLYEGKIFEQSTHYNQCAGVLSPPIVDIIEKQLQIPFPYDLVQRRIDGYALYSAHENILLTRDDQTTHALRRVAFDDYLLTMAKKKGVKVFRSRVTDIELHDNHVMVYSESTNSRADVVVGAFGLDDGTAKAFERTTPYKQPSFLSSIVTKIHPKDEFMSQFGSLIHAFLPPIKQIEFGAVTPKKNHLTVNIAGKHVTSELMNDFLRYPSVRALLPSDLDPVSDGLMYFKGRFPLRVSSGLYGNRYVIVGDAAGLLRPFKGKGVNMSIISGINAASTIMNDGISKSAFERSYRSTFSEVIDDIPYGKALRWLANKASISNVMDAFIGMAKTDLRLKDALFDCVSAHRPFKRIFQETLSTRLVAKIAKQILSLQWPHRKAVRKDHQRC